MSGRALRAYLEILRALATGPRTKRDLKLACGYDAVREYPTLDGLLRDMSRAGIIECRGKSWALAAGKEVCPTCQGRGLSNREGVA